MKKMNNKGFSLVELIIVIAIMAVLMGVLAPQFLKYVENSRKQKDESAIAEVENAIKIACSIDEVYTSLDAAKTTVTLKDGAKVTGGTKELLGELALTVPDVAGDKGKVVFASKAYKGKTVTIDVNIDSKTGSVQVITNWPTT